MPVQCSARGQAKSLAAAVKQLWEREDGAHRDGCSGARTQPRRDVAGHHAEPKRKFSEHLTPGDITDMGCSFEGSKAGVC